METRLYGPESPSDFRPSGPSDFRPPASFADSAPSASSINYSPKHSRVPSSLSTSRNINIKRLAVSPSAVAGPASPRRGKLALAIPVSASSPVGAYTPETPSKLTVAPEKRSYTTPDKWGSHGNSSTQDDSACRSADLRSPFSSQISSCNSSAESLSGRLSEVGLTCGTAFTRNTPEMRTTPDTRNPPGPRSTHDTWKRPETHPAQPQAHPAQPQAHPAQPETQPTHQPPPAPAPAQTHAAAQSPQHPTLPAAANATEHTYIPEELQESSNTNAYPQGPANVLNSILYLFSDPRQSTRPVDINDYDLVVNVARECENLSAAFDTRGGTRKYIHVPWSHTSAISEELPRLTREIAAMDQPGKKILVHCQCGVSRSACVVVAYFMVKFGISVNDAYELLKCGTQDAVDETARRIGDAGNHVDPCERVCPNMSLIFELMDFGDGHSVS